MSTRQTATTLVLCLAAVVACGSCSSGPAPAKMGTPQWYWGAARDTFRQGDLAKTQEHLEKLMTTDNPFKRRAATWHLVILAGLAEGHKDLAEAYDAGAGLTKTQAGDFRRVAADLRRLARLYSLGLAQEAGRFQKEAAETERVTLDFAFPRGSATEAITLDRLRKGIFPSEGERVTALQRTIERGVLLETAAVAGAGQDTAKAAELFKTQPVEAPRTVFLYGVASSLYDLTGIFDRKKLNEPDKKKILLDMAASCLQPVAAGSDESLKKKAKELQERLDKAQKTLGKA